VVPVAMVGTDKVQPIGKVLPRLAHVEVRIGPPLEPPKPATDPAELREQARVFTERVMDAIAALSGQARAAVDAAEYKARLARRRAAGTLTAVEPSAPDPYPADGTPETTASSTDTVAG
ncbi:MAG: lysophospholipid acyltransferase family protein, partial [Actinomycetes bacterium]